ncbi:hypothetical protein NKR23_g2282 [Pleurostoma richardsiae]|uniref:Large ribosomal subunit protein mL67 n=1 Tax=Pleurostoma richardsiae TaxID=41990 RepID=A0AA38RQE6_9PEZI|nr:hypothetical protein NKR23_g2282 [Pleurostoma richardsiae]
MNPSSSSVVERLSIGVSRISIRQSHTRPRWTKARPELTGFEPGHGERIWVFNHVGTNQIVYSHKNVMNSNRAMRQIPFNGKNLKPAKLRKDYWKPMAMIQFPAGLGVVGQNAFQKLREFKRLHELSWGYQTEEFYRKSKRERGEALNDQKANAVADIAAVLSGAGRGNKMLLTERDERSSTTEVAGGGAGSGEESAQLVGATIYWDNLLDRAFARSWSANVRHEEGLPELSSSPDVEVSETVIPPEPSHPTEGASVTA